MSHVTSFWGVLDKCVAALASNIQDLQVGQDLLKCLKYVYSPIIYFEGYFCRGKCCVSHSLQINLEMVLEEVRVFFRERARPKKARQAEKRQAEDKEADDEYDGSDGRLTNANTESR